MGPSDTISIIVLVILLILSAFFSSAETALTTVNKLRIRSLVEENNKAAKTVSKLIAHPSKMLSAILIGNNVVNLSASSLTTVMVSKWFDSVVVGIATGILTLLILIFGEITPKTLATRNSEKLSLSYAGIIYFFTQVLTPVIFVINGISHGLLKLFHVNQSSNDALVTEQELLTLVEVSHEEGVIESEEKEMIHNVVDFGDSLAKDIMVPRVEMSFVNDESNYDELVAAFAQDKYSRMPVYHETRDNVVGIIHLKDLFFYQGVKKDFNITEILREPFFTYEFKKTAELLVEMRKDSISMAVVLDEYGAVAGLITLEDLVEEIVGEIRDEYDSDEVDDIQYVSDTEYLVEGTTKLDDINDVLGTQLDSDDYDSIAGHIIGLCGHLPEVGETVTDGCITYTVKAVDLNRIDKIRIQITPDENLQDAISV